MKELKGLKPLDYMKIIEEMSKQQLRKQMEASNKALKERKKIIDLEYKMFLSNLKQGRQL